MRLIKGLCGFGLMFLPIVGCGGALVGPGDYVVLEVAYGDQQASSECNMPNLTSTSVKSSGSIALYAAGDEIFADIGTAGGNGDITLQGKHGDGSDFTFTGKNVTLQDVGPPNNRVKITTTETFTLDLKYDGSTATGSLKTKFDCASSGTNECDLVQPASGCSITTSFSGDRVDDVELKHEI